MRVRYVCEVCGEAFGELDVPAAWGDRLGFERLTAEERAELLSDRPDGGVDVLSICERCGPPVNVH